MIKRLLVVSFLGLYGALFLYTGWSDQQASIYNNPDGGNGDGYNPLPLEYQYTPDLPALVSPNAHLALADQAATSGKKPEARQHAFNALRHNPAGGQIALMLMNLYIQPDNNATILSTAETAQETGETEPEDTKETEQTQETSAEHPSPATEDEEEVVEETTLEEATLAEKIKDKTTLLRSLDAKERHLADQVATLAHTLRPTYTDTLMPLSEYWAAQHNLEKALPLWSTLLERYGDMQAELFPIFHQALHEPNQQKLFASYLLNPPSWWNAFFQYLLANEQDENIIRQYYQARIKSTIQPATAERNAYIDYLTRHDHWQDAYQIWHDSLNKQQLSLERLLHDGGFESQQKDSLQGGLFGWTTNLDNKIKISQAITRGMKGKHALQISFRKGTNIQFQHVSQTRLLQPGNYTMTGRYRLDRFDTGKGLRWRMRCMDKDSSLLGESPLFNGQTDWEFFEFTFTVQAGCTAQILRLESDTPYPHHNTFSGSIWFDDLNLPTTSTQTPHESNTPPVK